MCDQPFHFVDSVDEYYLGKLAKNCPESEIVPTPEDCIDAAAQLEKKYQKIFDSGAHPAGCLYFANRTDVYFNNPDPSLTTKLTANAGGICKRGMLYLSSHK